MTAPAVVIIACGVNALFIGIEQSSRRRRGNPAQMNK
jgi:hypothetical protein